MELPASVTKIVKDAVAANPGDIPAAIDASVAGVRNLPEYPDIIEALTRNAVSFLVYQSRHAVNVELKKQAGGYGGPAKVAAASDAVRDAYRSYFDYTIGKRTLGLLTGLELDAVADQEGNIANGHLFNVELCRLVRAKVNDDEVVKDVLKEKRLAAIFKAARKTIYGDGERSCATDRATAIA